MNEEEKDGDGNLDADKDNGKDEEDENENEEEEEQEEEEEEAEETPLFPRQPALTNVAARFDRERLVREGRGKKISDCFRRRPDPLISQDKVLICHAQVWK